MSPSPISKLRAAEEERRQAKRNSRADQLMVGTFLPRSIRSEAEDGRVRGHRGGHRLPCNLRSRWNLKSTVTAPKR